MLNDKFLPTLCTKMPLFVEKILFVIACLTVPIAWGIIVNWVFHRLKTATPNEDDSGNESQDEPVIEYYI
ncbi:MAG: hypothetical protein ISQ06_10995 [Planctomycetaceae bacterium]|jgi:hypothetical protein|nr:hypothetical protein [Planctomycetaceae bacterium]